MKHTASVILMLCFYLGSQLLGLYVGETLLARIAADEFVGAVEDPESAGSSALIFLYILVMTGVLLVLIRYRLEYVIRGLLLLSVGIGLALTLWALTGVWETSLAASALGLVLFVWKKEDPYIADYLLVGTIAGFGGWLGASLSLIPALLLLSALACYDLVAVFGTKHMVTLAEASRGSIAFMLRVPTENSELGLGTGDLAIPLTFSVAVLGHYGSLSVALATVVGGFAGIATLLYLVTRRKKTTLPALPPIAAGLLVGFALGYGLLLAP